MIYGNEGMKKKMKRPSMKDMASKMMKKADRFMDRVVETGTPMTEKEAKTKGYR